jgi:DNA-binding transcriptional ArsR family regulator
MEKESKRLTMSQAKHGDDIQVHTSIMMELDVTLSALFNKNAITRRSKELGELLEQIPGNWLDDIAHLPIDLHHHNSFLEMAAHMARVLFEDNYSSASQKMRDLDVRNALERITELYRPYGLMPDSALSLPEQIADLQYRGSQADYHELGFEIQANSALSQKLLADCKHAAAILKGGASHVFFWNWLDRFVREYYADWRIKNQPILESEKERASTALESTKNQNFTKMTGWLSRVNPLVGSQALRAAASSGRFSIVLWAEPFHLMDSWSLYPGLIIVSYAEPTIGLKEFEQQVREIAVRTAALGDPTRLTILRLIRHFGLVNTEIAAYLNMARPTVSIHARILRDAGLITSKKVGRETHHEICWEEMKKFLQDFENFLEFPK